MPSIQIPEGVLPYATEKQATYIQAYWRLGTLGAVAEEFGVKTQVISEAIISAKRKAAKYGVDDCGAQVDPVPDGYRVKGKSILYDGDGLVKAQWVKTEKDAESYDAIAEAIAALCQEIPRLPPVNAPDCTADLLSLYPVGDHHIGMLSWHEETGDDYDTHESERLLIGAMDYLVDAAPGAGRGIVALMGDYLHYDSYESVTPSKNKHQLDADTRYPRMVQAAMKTVRHAISRALEKHAEVTVVVVSGNHDPASMAFLREALHCLYENEPRVTVDRTPRPFHYVRFGKNLMGFHHGDKVKMQNLPLVMASDCPSDWGATEHRYVFTGHVHHDAVKDFTGARVESLRILPPVDAYAHGLGYRSARDMKRIDYHAEFGEIGRQIVTPDMLRTTQE